MIPQSFLEAIEARATMSALVGRRVKLEKNGREFKACCPVHSEKTPSFTVNNEKGFAHCFGCGFHAGPLRWLTEIEGLDFLDAVRQLAEDAGMALPERSSAEQARAARVAGVRPALEAAQALFAAQLGRVTSIQQYLQRRGVSQALAEQFGLGLAPEGRDYLNRAGIGPADALAAGLMWQKDAPASSSGAVGQTTTGPRFLGRITVPVHDARGRIVGFGARAAPGAPEGTAKYLNSPDSEIFDKGRTLFNLHRAAPAIRASKRALVVEGYFDVIALAGAGIAEAVAPMGTALTEAQMDRLWRLCRAPVLLFDGDAAGRKAARRACERALPALAPDRTLKVALLPRGQDPDDLVRAEGAAGIEAVLADAMPLDGFLFGCVAQGIGPDSSPEDRAQVWADLAALGEKIAHEDLRAEYLAAWRARYDRLISGVDRAGRATALHTVTGALAGTSELTGDDYLWPESEDESEKRLIAVVRRLIELRADERAAVEPIREERKFVRELAKLAGLHLPQIDAVVKMLEADFMEGSKAGRHAAESVLVLYRRVLAIDGPLTEAFLPPTAALLEAGVAGRAQPAPPAPRRGTAALAWHDAGAM